jgi:hypothetical protein
VPNVIPGDNGPTRVYNPTDTPGLNPWGHPYPTIAPPPPVYPTGPIYQQSYYHAPAKAAAPAPVAPDPWKGISAGAHDQAVNLADKFGASLGWPNGWDVNAWSLKLAQSGINLNSQLDSYDWLFQNAVSDGQRQANPWAQLGMDKDTYNTLHDKMNSVFSDWTGNQLDAATMLQALRGNWTPDEIKNFAIYGSPTGGTTPQASASFLGDMPWLSSGQTYTQTLQGFTSFEDHAPSDRQTLAAWFRFGQSVKQTASRADPTATPNPKMAAMSEVR